MSQVKKVDFTPYLNEDKAYFIGFILVQERHKANKIGLSNAARVLCASGECSVRTEAETKYPALWSVSNFMAAACGGIIDLLWRSVLENLNIKILSDLLEEFRQELNEIDKKLGTHKNIMREDKKYLDFLMSKESEDHMIFSPRNVADIHKDEIKDISSRRERMSSENGILIEKRNILCSRIERLEFVLKNLADD